MREIKFRAWDQAFKLMQFELPEEYELTLSGQINVVDSNGGKRQSKEFVLMQFTGLKDKNGVEIYESDIVNYHFIEDHLCCTVMWNDERCCFGFKDKGEDVIYGVNTDDVSKRAEVIGNIYENPELLKDES